MNREQMTKIRFDAYVNGYDMSNSKVALKAVHTYKVAELCREISKGTGLSEEDCFVAWMCGMLHDIGRFEQIKRYNTFVDADSVDHAVLSTEILFGDGQRKQGIIREFIQDDAYDDLIHTAILYHSAYRLPEKLDQRKRKFCDILRDADKIDIFRVNLETPMEEIYNTTTKELRESEVTPEVLQAFMEHHAVLRELKKTPVDNVVGHLALFYELVYPISREIALNQGYLKRLSEFESLNPKTQEVFAAIGKELKNFNR